MTDNFPVRAQEGAAADELRQTESSKRPQRTCVGCRAKKDKAGLLRLVMQDGALVPDVGGVLHGRGAYLCRSEACLKEALKKRDVFSRALRSKVSAPDAGELLIELTGCRL
ncbi:MAG: hypothetical protein A3J24_05480 [Deltaproteobacteria bacterium RIFCSPLOWO2_02_FULL_53_8]|nr:MAG: hypothetical protein A3J24_05480 [Deltaproteobacteria bacterium RIFCSPLOWO2_02_FULL_53_8]